jgi:hypothetical protein
MNFLLGAWAKFRVEVEDVGPSQGPGWDFFCQRTSALKFCYLLFALAWVLCFGVGGWRAWLR